MTRLLLVLLGLLVALPAAAQDRTAERLTRVLRAGGVPVVGVSIGTLGDSATWTVQPAGLQPMAQPIIDSFNPTDPAYVQAELDEQIIDELGEKRLSSAIVWVILKQMYPADTDAQTKSKFAVARARIIAAYTAEIWKP
jgi:hypothetical protein